MTRRPTLTLTFMATMAAGVLSGCGLRDPNATPRPATAPQPTATATSTSTNTSAAGGLSAGQINRQDHPPAAMVRRQRAATRRRPLLPALPVTQDGVRIAIGGLARDGQTTILTITARHGDRAHTLAVYRRVLRRYGDSGRAYHVRVTR